MNISIDVKAPELAQAILALASALGGKNEFQQIVNQGVSDAQQAKPPVQQQAPATVPTAPPVQQYQPPVQQQPAQQAPTQQPPVQQQAPQGVPTSAPTYTMDQLAVAATQLMDAGRQQELLALLASFGAQTLMTLPQEQYGAFATKLREMGAQI